MRGLFSRSALVLGCAAAAVVAPAAFEGDATLVCVDESPSFRFTFPTKGNSTCFGLCWSSVNANAFANRTAAFSCEAAIEQDGGALRDLVCGRCPKNCNEQCFARTHAPTTAMPSGAPTAQPTAQPSVTPFPSAPPSVAPSGRPSAVPRIAPTAVPTAAPSPIPSTGRPTSTPTAAPTFSPSSAPTGAPTLIPPTAAPSSAPTAHPSFVPTATPSMALKVFITELADPSNEENARYVELYSPSGGSLDGLRLERSRVVSKYSTSVSMSLDGETLGIGAFLILCANRTAFDHVFHPVSCHVDAGAGGPADVSGDDALKITDGAGNVFDVFGVVGTSGGGTAYDFRNGRAERVAGVFTGLEAFVLSEWTMDNDSGAGAGAVAAPAGFDPKAWVGA